MGSRRMTRREILRQGAVGTVGMAALAGKLAPDRLAGTTARPAQAAAPASRPARRPPGPPNILLAIADDWGWPHAGSYGDKVVKTPTFDRLAREGVLFRRAYCAAPSCSPSRASILTGQMFWRLEEAANLWSTLPAKFQTYTDILARPGPGGVSYHVGCTRKGWGPGNVQAGGRNQNPAGRTYKTFEVFLKSVPEGSPFCFWFGSHDPHRPYERGSGLASGRKPADVAVPPFLPDCDETRCDLLDYYFEVERFDREVGQILALLEETGRLENTLVVMTSDNGMPFPRCKSNLSDYGTHEPLAIRWPAEVKGGRAIDDFVGLHDLAPTLLAAAGREIPADMTGRSLLDILTSDRDGRVDPRRDRVFVGKERHAAVRAGNVGYPCRAIRTRQHLYIRNFEPDRWPAGDPPDFGDIDGGPTKAWLLDHRDDRRVRPLFDLACGKRPGEELYDLQKDPCELVNVAARSEYEPVLKKLAGELTAYLKETGDPRVIGGAEKFDTYPYYGQRAVPKTQPEQQR